MKNGLCKLPLSDWPAIVDIVGISVLVENFDAFKSSVETAEDCLEFYFWLVARESL